MPTFDEKQGVVTVRIAYDGPACAGKTENLRHLHQTFAPSRRGELITPEERDGRTRYFDWLNLSGGVVAGLPLRAQLVTVPGQSSLLHRRWALLDAADAIVFVCESTAGGVRQARRSLELLRAKLAARGKTPPLVVQANKQDLPNSLAPADLVAALGLPADTVVVAARANAGVGVRDTVVHAIRAAATETERILVASGPGSLPAAEDADELLAALDGTAALQALTARDDPAPPPMPNEDAPSSRLFPARKARTYLRAVSAAVRAGRLHRVPAARALVLRAGDVCLRTSDRYRAASAVDARKLAQDAMLFRLRLGGLKPDEIAFACADDARGGWLWLAMPWLNTLRSELDASLATKDGERLRAALRAYARALALAAELATADGLLLHLEPSHFAIQGDRVVYVSEATHARGDLAAELHGASRALAPYLSAAVDREQFAKALMSALASVHVDARVKVEELARRA